jgi:outer membrane protein FlgP
MMRFYKLLAIAFCLPLALNACSSTFLTRNMTLTHTAVKKPSEFPVLRATGYAPISRQPGATSAIKQIKAMRASKMEAYRELSEQVNGIYINATDSLNSSNQETSHSLKSEVDGFVQGARVIRQYAVGDTYATEVELDSRLVYDLYDMRGAL